MEDWFEIMRDVLLNPTSPEPEFERIREDEIAGLRQQRTRSGFLAISSDSVRPSSAINPASTRSATDDSLDAMSTEILARWHRERYATQNSVLSIAGDVDAQDIFSDLNEWLEDWERTDYVVELPPDPETPALGRIFLVDRPDSAQATIYMGTLALDRRHPDYIPLTVMNQVLGWRSLFSPVHQPP